MPALACQKLQQSSHYSSFHVHILKDLNRSRAFSMIYNSLEYYQEVCVLTSVDISPTLIQRCLWHTVKTAVSTHSVDNFCNFQNVLNWNLSLKLLKCPLDSHIIYSLFHPLKKSLRSQKCFFCNAAPQHAVFLRQYFALT